MRIPGEGAQGPSTVTEEPVEAYAHCANARCPGYAQEAVPAIRQETSRTYQANGGQLPGVENSQVHYRFADEEANGPCPGCGRMRELSADQRPSYNPISGFDPNYLVGSTAQGFDPSMRNTESDAKVAELEARLTAQSEKMDKLIAALAQGEED